MSESLHRYISRLQAEWPDDDRQWRAIDGTLLFVDISGFTALSERLAKQGPSGTELLTDVLNLRFGQLLDIAARFGGDFIKFGGDALLLQFTEQPGDDRHAVRAATAAWLMQQQLRRRIKVDGVSRLRIAASMGVHSGEILAFRVGADYDDVILAGPAVDTVLAMESSAAAGQILLSRHTADLVGPDLTGPTVGAGRILVASPGATALPAPPAPRPARSLSTRVALSPPLREILTVSGAIPQEHRSLAIGFVRCAGLGVVLHIDGPDALAAALHQVTSAVQRAAARQNLTVVEVDVLPDAVKFLIIAGAPVSSGDDTDRLLLGLGALADDDLALPTAIGAHRGRVFIGPVGSADRIAYGVLGDAVNTAARVASHAGPGQLLVTDQCVLATLTAFSVQPVPPFAAKGKRHQLRASLLGRVTGTRDRLSEVPQIGRDHRLAELHAAAVRSRNTRVVATVSGPPGIGKSLLLRELARGIDPGRTIRVSGGRHSSSSPYHAVVPALIDLIGGTTPAALTATVTFFRPDLLPHLALLAPVLGMTVPETAESLAVPVERRASRSHELWALIVHAARPSVSIIVDDGHWLDSASAHLLQAISDWRIGAPGLVVVARRDVPGGWTPSQVDLRIELEPLSPDESMALVDAATPQRPLRPEHARRLVSMAAGNPYFLLETIAAVADQSTGPIPDTVESLLAAALDELDHASREMLIDAAVLGTQSSIALLAHLSGLDPDRVDRRLRSLARFITVDGDQFEFASPLARDVAYQAAPFRRRRAAHQRAGELLGRLERPPHDQLSVHYQMANDPVAAWNASRAAADAAQARYASAEEAAFLQRCLDVHQPGLVSESELTEVYGRMGGACFQIGDFRGAALAYDRQARREPDIVGRVAARHRQALAVDRLGRYAQAARLLRQAIHEIEGASRVVRQALPPIVHAQASMLYRQGRLTEALTVTERAAWVAVDYDDRATLARAYLLLGSIRGELGMVDDDFYLHRTLQLGEELGDIEGQARALNNLAAADHEQGRWPTAIERYNRSAELFERCGASVEAVMPRMNAAELRLDQGIVGETVDELRRVVRHWESVEYSYGVTYASSLLGLAQIRSGDVTTGLVTLDGAISRCEQIGVAGVRAQALLYRSEGLALLGRRIEACEQLRDLAVLAAVEQQPVLRAKVSLLVGVLTEDDNEARAALMVARAAAERCASQPEQALVARAMRLRGLSDDRDTEWINDAEVLATLGVTKTIVDALAHRRIPGATANR